MPIWVAHGRHDGVVRRDRSARLPAHADRQCCVSSGSCPEAEATHTALLEALAVASAAAGDGGAHGTAGEDQAVRRGSRGGVLAVRSHGEVRQQLVQVGVADNRNRLIGVGAGLAVRSLSLALGATHTTPLSRWQCPMPICFLRTVCPLGARERARRCGSVPSQLGWYHPPGWYEDVQGMVKCQGLKRRRRRRSPSTWGWWTSARSTSWSR